MRTFKKSSKLDNVCYEIRGPVLEAAKRLEAEGRTIIKLNTGNPPAFGINAPDEIIQDIIYNIKTAEAYADSKGLFSARKAIMQYCQTKTIFNVDVDDIYIGNGVSEMIVMAMQGLLDNGDEVLVPRPDYPLWTAAVTLAGGRAVHYRCDEASDWNPDIADMKKCITRKTKAIVVINPNNPTGAVYPKEILTQIVALAAEHDLIVYADEIYDQLVYDDIEHVSLASLSEDIPFITFNGLSKSHRIPGMRAGWMIVSGKKDRIADYIEGLTILATMRLCGNVTAQLTIQTALGGYQSLNELIRPGGRLYEQRNAAYEIFNAIPGVQCAKPKSALYAFPKIDVKRFHITNDERFAYDFLMEKNTLIVQGTGFNWDAPDHFRIVFLPPVETLKDVGERMADFLSQYRQ